MAEDFDIDWRDVEHRDNLVRSYSADGQIYAMKDGHEHLIESLGREAATRWTKRVHAERSRVVPGQQLWTIPSNWEFKIKSKRDYLNYGIFHIPQSNTYVKVAIPTNDRLVDAWYSVKAVGDLSFEPVGEFGSKNDAYRLANEFEHEDSNLYDVLRDIAMNWDIVEDEYDNAVQYIEDEKSWDNELNGPVIATDEFEIVFRERIVRLKERLNEVLDQNDYDADIDYAIDELNYAGLLPKYDRVKATIDESNTSMKTCVLALIEAGCTPPEALDYYNVEIDGMSQNWWATQRGVDNSTVSRNVSKARRKIQA